MNVVTGHRHRAGEVEWMAATGEICIVCGQEFQRGRDHMCMKCWEAVQNNKITVEDKTGMLDYFGENILQQITHKSKSTK